MFLCFNVYDLNIFFLANHTNNLLIFNCPYKNIIKEEYDDIKIYNTDAIIILMRLPMHKLRQIYYKGLNINSVSTML